MDPTVEVRGRQAMGVVVSDNSQSSGRPTKWAGSSSRSRVFDKSTFDTIITGHLTLEQLEAYQQQFRIAEITSLMNESVSRRRPISSLLPSGEIDKNPNFKRDASPPPTYDKAGVRTNTRDVRINDQLEKERGFHIEVAAKSIKNFVPPLGYRKQTKTMEKLFIPVKDYPDINFVGLLLGPRGKTLRLIQEQSGAKLAIRGKGSVKEGKSMPSYPDEDRGASGPASFLNPNLNSNQDDLHVVITAEFLSAIAKAIQLTNEIIEKAISSPEGQNNLKRDQLRELAVLNGTLRESRPFDANGEQRQGGRGGDFTDIVCNQCGKVGHFARDCLMRGQGSGVATGTNAAPLPPRGHEKRAKDDSVDTHGSHEKRDADDGIDMPPWKMRKEEVAQPPWQAPQTGYLQSGPPPATYLPPGYAAPLAAPPPGQFNLQGQTQTYLPPTYGFVAPPPPGLNAPPSHIHGAAVPPPSYVQPPPPSGLQSPHPYPPSTVSRAPPPPPGMNAPPQETSNAPPPPSTLAPPPSLNAPSHLPPTVPAPPPPTSGAPPSPSFNAPPLPPSTIAPPPPPPNTNAPPPPPTSNALSPAKAQARPPPNY